MCIRDRSGVWREELATLGQQLSEIERAGGAAAVVRRLPDRARWARLSLLAAAPQGRHAAALELGQVRERLREAVLQRPEELRLVRALARINELVLRGAARGTSIDGQRCEWARADLALMVPRVQLDPLVVEMRQAAAACGDLPDPKAVPNSRGAAASGV